jgi:phosphoglycolate phosphatase
LKKYNTVLFDFDGTVVDSSEGIINSAEYVLEKYGIAVKEKTELFKFIGPPLMYSFMTFYNFSEEKSKEAITHYRQYYEKYGINQNRLYDGMEELLKNLKANGKTVGVMTSKPEHFAKKILEDFNISKYFDFVCGASLDELSRSTKIEVMEYGIKTYNVNDKNSTIMIGDRNFDIDGANFFGFDSIGVLFGFGSREEFVKAGATYIVESPKEIEKIILEN